MGARDRPIGSRARSASLQPGLVDAGDQVDRVGGRLRPPRVRRLRKQLRGRLPGCGDRSTCERDGHQRVEASPASSLTPSGDIPTTVTSAAIGRLLARRSSNSWSCLMPRHGRAVNPGLGAGVRPRLSRRLCRAHRHRFSQHGTGRPPSVEIRVDHPPCLTEGATRQERSRPDNHSVVS